MTTLLQIVNRAQGMLNLPITTTVYSNTGDAQKQLLALSNMEGDLLAGDYTWPKLITENSFVTTATNQQTNGSLPTDLVKIIDETLWNRDLKVPVYGPLSPRIWQAQKGIGITSIYPSFRIKNGYFWFDPAPSAGETIYYEYVSSKWCETSLAVGNTSWTADTDVSRLPPEVMTLGLVWRWLEAKGFDYSNRYDEWNKQKAQAQAQSSPRRHLSIIGPPYGYTPSAPFLTEGSWSIT